MARRVITRRVHTVRKSEKVWFDAALATNKVSVAAASAVLLASLDTEGLDQIPFTILRTRLQVWWSSDQTASNEEPQGAFAMGVVSAPASAAGIGSIPTPITESNFPWVVYQPMIAGIQVATAVGAQNPSGNYYEVDSKSMRKVKLGEDIVFVVENNSAADGAEILFLGRFLVQLH